MGLNTIQISNAGKPVSSSNPLPASVSGDLVINLNDSPVSDTNPLPVTQPDFVAIPSANFTRPNDTTAYASGDLVANSTTAGSVVVMSFANAVLASGGYGRLERVRIRKSGTGVTNANFRVHFFNAAPATITNGDNGAFSVSGTANYIGAFDVTTDRAFTDGAAGSGISMTGTPVTFVVPSGTTIYALIEARGAYTPAAQEVFTVLPEIYRFA